MKRIIPIFPLSLVVFPLSRYPLHIFEPRYKKLINYCLKNKTGFGIVTTVDKELHEIGCYVEIDEVLDVSETGEMDIIIKGIEKFRMSDNWINTETGYLIAEIDDYEDVDFSHDEVLFLEAESIFKQLIQRINYELDEGFWNNLFTSRLKSYKLAEKSGFSLAQQLMLLKFRDESARLSFIIDHLQKLEKYLDEKDSITDLTINDGYLN
ncbi:MAG: LON peptidase substrate-binding domain-containing protein [Ignavibacteriaceae bacterium]